MNEAKHSTEISWDISSTLKVAIDQASSLHIWSHIRQFIFFIKYWYYKKINQLIIRIKHDRERNKYWLLCPSILYFKQCSPLLVILWVSRFKELGSWHDSDWIPGRIVDSRSEVETRRPTLTLKLSSIWLRKQEVCVLLAYFLKSRTPTPSLGWAQRELTKADKTPFYKNQSFSTVFGPVGWSSGSNPIKRSNELTVLSSLVLFLFKPFFPMLCKRTCLKLFQKNNKSNPLPVVATKQID